MNKRTVRTAIGSALLLILPVIAFAQDARVVSAAGDKYVISARAGGVNFTEGAVSISRFQNRNGALVKGGQIEIGDTVRTGASSKAEILLNPGSYLRVGANTEFQFITTSLDDLRVKLLRGSAIFEVIADNDFKVSLITPADEVSMTRSGVYRFDVAADGDARVSVIRGKLDIGDENSVKSGKTAAIGNGAVTVAKYQNDDDELDAWSKDRAKQLSKINAGLQRRAMRTTLLDSFNRNSWNFYESFGLWIFDPARRSWCFLPFGSGWGSPYGYGYGFDIWSTGIPIWVYNQPPPAPVKPRSPGEPPASGGAVNRSPMKRVPFETIERNDNGGIVRRPMPRDDSPVFPGFPPTSLPPASVSVPAAAGVPPTAPKGKP
jgi:hypothetical protein